MVYLIQRKNEEIDKQRYPVRCNNWGPNAKKSEQEKNSDEANWYSELDCEIDPRRVLNW
jgi:hypothetical protein